MKLCPICATSYPADRRTCPTHGAVLVDTAELPPGTIIRDCYRVERTLGRGGMGTVYLAEHTLLGEPRALKFLSGALASNNSFVQRFLQEARAASKLRHPNIAATLELGQAEDGSLYICMEYVDGPSLRFAIQQARGGLAVDRAFNIARGVVEGLGAAHAKRMVHRDVKPENILLATAPGQNGVVETAKVVDFGIVALSTSDGNLTQTGRPLLTAEYAAPEQWRGVLSASEFDGRTDLYSFGCMFFEMLTGQLPFRSESYEGWFDLHLHAVPPKVSSVRPELGRYDGLDALVASLLAKDRENRPAGAAPVLAELDRIFTRGATTLVLNQDIKLPDGRGGKQKASDGSAQVKKAAEKPTAAAPKKGGMLAAAILIPAALLILAVVGTVLYLRKSDAAEEARLRQQRTSETQVPTTPNPTTAQPPTAVAPAPDNASVAGTDTAKPSAAGPSLPTPAPANPPAKGSSKAGSNAKPAPEPVVSNDPAAVTARAVALYNSRDYTQAASLFDQACQGNNLQACTRLAGMYLKHTGVAEDSAHALSLYGRGCDGGDAEACAGLASMHQHKSGAEQNLPRAVIEYGKACNGGSMSACNSLGLMYQHSQGVEQDFAKALVLYQKACDGSMADGCNNLGYLYQHKVGVDQDYSKAATLYTKGCDLGNSFACNNLGIMYEDKEGVEQDYSHAATLYDKACSAGSGNGCSDLGELYRKGNGVDKDPAKARTYLAMGCSMGNKFGCERLKLVQ